MIRIDNAHSVLCADLKRANLRLYLETHVPSVMCVVSIVAHTTGQINRSVFVPNDYVSDVLYQFAEEEL